MCQRASRKKLNQCRLTNLSQDHRVVIQRENRVIEQRLKPGCNPVQYLGSVYKKVTYDVIVGLPIIAPLQVLTLVVPKLN